MSRGFLGGQADRALGVVVGEPMGSEEDGDGAVGILVNPDDGLDEVRPEAALRQLQRQAAPFDRVVVADGALLLNAEYLRPGHGPIVQEVRAFLLGGDCEGGVVLRNVSLRNPAIGGFDGGDTGQRQFLGQPVLKRPEARSERPRASGE